MDFIYEILVGTLNHLHRDSTSKISLTILLGHMAEILLDYMRFYHMILVAMN